MGLWLENHGKIKKKLLKSILYISYFRIEINLLSLHQSRRHLHSRKLVTNLIWSLFWNDIIDKFVSEYRMTLLLMEIGKILWFYATIVKWTWNFVAIQLCPTLRNPGHDRRAHFSSFRVFDSLINQWYHLRK